MGDIEDQLPEIPDEESPDLYVAGSEQLTKEEQAELEAERRRHPSYIPEEEADDN